MLTTEIINSFEFQGELLLRMILAVLCGAIIGHERRRSQKEAGIRTHIFVALGACVFAICSKYAFTDMIGMHGVNFDMSRISSNLVTGCCFLGAGMIFVRNRAVTGLTTAAGVWVVAAIGLCFGTGMYIVGAGAMVIDIVVQYCLHVFFDRVEGASNKHFTFILDNSDNVLDDFVEVLRGMDKHLIVDGISHKESNQNIVTLNVRISVRSVEIDILEFMKRYPYVLSAEL